MCAVVVVELNAVLSSGDVIEMIAVPPLVTSVVAVAATLLRLRPVTVIVVFAFGASGNAGIVNVPVVSLVGFVCTAIDDVIVDGSMFTYVPVTSIVGAPVCVPGSGDVIESLGGSLKYFTRTLAVPMRLLVVIACAVMMLRPLPRAMAGTEYVPFDGVNGFVFTSPPSTPAVTVPLTSTVDVGETKPFAGEVIVIVASGCR